VVSDKLEPCPFCGSKPETWAATYSRNHIHIQCRKKTCLARPHIEDYSPRAIAAWNRRPEEDVLHLKINGLLSCLDKLSRKTS